MNGFIQKCSYNQYPLIIIITEQQLPHHFLYKICICILLSSGLHYNHDKLYHDTSYHDKLHHDKLYHDKSYHDKLYHDTSYHDKLYHDKSYHDKSYHDKIVS